MTLVQDNSVQAINTALLSIKRDISASTATTAGTTAGLEPGKTYNINISGNAETATTAKTARTATNANRAETAANANHAETAETVTKMSNALTVNGKTYNGSEAVDAGVQTVANGGTGVTTQADINKAFIGNLAEGTSDVTDGTEFVSSWASDNGFAETEGGVNTPYKRKFSTVWNYIKGKISSVLGLTKDNYGGKASTAGTADRSTTASYADRLIAFASWNNPYDYDSTNGVRVYVYKITMASYFNSVLVQIYDDINYARCRRYVLGLWHVNGYGYSVSVTDLGGTKDGGLHVWMGTDGNVYLQADVYWTSRIAFSRLDDITDVTITKIGEARYGSNADINGNVLFTPLADPIVDCGALRADDRLSSASKVPQILKTDVLRASSRLTIPIGAPSSPQDGDIWIER